MIEVSAAVIDGSTADSIPSATIAVNGKAVGETDSDGNFSINVNSYDDQVTVSSIGYKTQTQSAADVLNAGAIGLELDPQSLATATVTHAAPAKTNYWPWLILGGVIVVGSSRKHSRAVSGKGSNLVPIALVGAGAYLLLKGQKSPLPAGSTATSPSTPVTSPNAGTSSILNPANLSSLANLFKGLFGSSDASYTPGIQEIPGTTSPSPAGDYSSLPTTAPIIPIDPGAYSSGSDTSYDPSDYGMSFAGIGATTTLNAGDIIGKTMIAAEKVPLYDTPRDDAQPSGYVNQGNPIGIVYSYLNPDTSQGRAELWWMFEPLPGDSDIGDNLGYYYVPHHPDYFDTQALLDAGVLTVAQATALKQSGGQSTLDTYLKKYLPWVGGILLAGVVIKSVVNKAI